ncbi:MAG: hypothetical protein V5788_02515 [Shewanella sp.]
MNNNTDIGIAIEKGIIFKIETNEINTDNQDIDLEFIYNEFLAIDKQVSILKQAEVSPFEIFSASPYEREHIGFSHLHKVIRQTNNVEGMVIINKGISENLLSFTDEGTLLFTNLKAHFEKHQITLMYNFMQLYKAIGEFNQFVTDYQYITRTKLADAQASFYEFEKFEEDYLIALDFTYAVFSHFYVVEKNRFYKVRTLISTIEAYCIAQRIPYPKASHSKAFADFYSKILMFATEEAKNVGRSLKDYKVIDPNNFEQNYGHLLRKNLLPHPP